MENTEIEKALEIMFKSPVVNPTNILIPTNVDVKVGDIIEINSKKYKIINRELIDNCVIKVSIKKHINSNIKNIRRN